MEDLKRRLREAAAAHEPDREGMLSRVHQGISHSPRPRRRAAAPLSWPRVTLATVASTAALVAGGFAIAATVHGGGSGREVATVPAAPSHPSAKGRAPDPSHPSATDRAPDPSHPSATDRAPDPSPPAGAPPRSQDGPLRSEGAVDPHSNAFWAQSNLTFHTGVPLRALTVEVRIAQTGGVASTGAWRTLPTDDFTLTTVDKGGALTYRWTLKPGRTVPPGRHVFAVQYNHAQGPRAATADVYTASATTAEGQRYTVAGRFRAAPRATAG
ncbi:hypothetical protein AB0M57_07875 [Streptomyces sp. NPDC051597]|uniref:hypothetical protein n=1 Tax=Streptomyces sp. NPDC051597 TaxID=3155049 RepID=UPI0034377917